MSFDELIGHHERIALQFSGGRDSLALLLALRPYWPRLTVYYTNSGDPYPETKGLVDAVKHVVPRFVEIEGRVAGVHAEFGLPSDVLQPGVGYQFARTDIEGYVPLIDRHFCCMKSIMEPMHERMKADGITLLLRGQRSEESTKSHVKSGEVIDGIQIAFPINDWTTQQVEQFIEQCGVPPPPFYAHGLTSSPDCMRCTAWLEHGAHKYLSKVHPAVAAEVNERLAKIKVVVQPFIDRLNAAQEILNGTKQLV